MNYVALLMVALMSCSKGYVDATWGDPEVHPGTKNDRWHLVARYGYLWPACLGWFMPNELSWWTPLFVALAGVVSFVAFRVGVYLGGRYTDWFGGKL